jgi:Pentapeptide repeats (8 copies)
MLVNFDFLSAGKLALVRTRVVFGLLTDPLLLQNANLSDVLMDRAVINEANLRNANFQRAVLTRFVPGLPSSLELV